MIKNRFVSAIFILTSAITLNATSTMCFLENHTSMSTAEDTALKGGECKGENSLKQMKIDGWRVDDIKISSSNSGMNYIYILKKDELIKNTKTLSIENEDEFMNKMYKKYEKKRELEKKAIVESKNKQLAEEGKTYYINKCQECHGEKGELEARGFSRPLNSLSLEDMKFAIRDYTNGTYDRGLAILMQPIAYSITEEDIKKVYLYINNLKKAE